MTMQIANGSRLSGGGVAVATNLATLAERWPERYRVCDGDDLDPTSQLLWATNSPPASVLLGADNLVLLPQNAWPFSRFVDRASCRRWLSLRAASMIAYRRATGVVRIGSSIPAHPAGVSTIVPNALDTGFDAALERALCQPAALPTERLVVSGGSIGPYRNLETLISAIHRLDRMGEEAHFIHVGAASSLSRLRDLQRRVEAARLRSIRVTLTGFGVPREAMLALLRSASVVALPSLVEASPVTLLEARAIRCQVVASDTAGHRDLLPPGRGQFVKSRDITGWVRAIQGAWKAPYEGPEPLATPEGRRSALVDWQNRIDAALLSLDHELRVRGGRRPQIA